MNTTTSFYMVMRDKEGTYVSKRHLAYPDAHKEATRLAKKEQAPFIILKAIRMLEPQDVPVKCTSLVYPIMEYGDDEDTQTIKFPSVQSNLALDRAKQKIGLVTDIAIGYDGHRDANDLMKLIDEMRELAGDAYLLLAKVKDE